MGKGKKRRQQEQNKHQDKYAAPDGRDQNQSQDQPQRGAQQSFDENASLDDALGDAAAPGGFEQGQSFGER
ncbi:hypothetical protein G5C51_18385 [Streptomyces sp. A7024]|uniref:Uncharacterized protein n=1 Tax=Streptomyces coryli TaxID=1128680 RepID=A0A6G4U0U4_9ACTN|nr:hypothetical protein [Streptomyces coryli]NGN65855.1 hypothetical protein [Streptomyces coryli]